MSVSLFIEHFIGSDGDYLLSFKENRLLLGKVLQLNKKRKQNYQASGAQIVKPPENNLPALKQSIT